MTTASRIIGRVECPDCGFEAAHVKQSEKCIYRYCPNCGLNGPHARTDAQRANMTRKMRPVEPTPTPTEKSAPAPAKPATPTPPTPPTPTPTGKEAPEVKKSALFNW